MYRAEVLGQSQEQLSQTLIVHLLKKHLLVVSKIGGARVTLAPRCKQKIGISKWPDLWHHQWSVFVVGIFLVEGPSLAFQHFQCPPVLTVLEVNRSGH